MLRGAIYPIAIAALIINALTPKTIADKSQTASQKHFGVHVSRPRSQQRLRVSARAFSCPPLSNTATEDSAPPLLLGNVKMHFAAIKINKFCSNAYFMAAPDILKSHCRLNI